MNVSVVIPAHSAAKTLPQTLASVRAQTRDGWEVIVIDDGSRDATAAVAAEFARIDQRVRVLSQPHGGEAVARNRGIMFSSFDWLLFLDADDSIEPTYLEKITGRLATEPVLDAVYCDWVRVTPDGEMNTSTHSPAPDELFTTAARFCPFAIHACVVRRARVLEAGCFDASLRTCPDWDLWQRVARTGARFGHVAGTLAYYHMRPDSAGLDALQVLADGWRVLECGHGPDPRVARPDPRYARGLPHAQLHAARVYLLCWVAGLLLGRGYRADWLASRLGQNAEAALDPGEVANRIFDSVLLPCCRVPSAWPRIWPDVRDAVAEFLLSLESHTGAAGLAYAAGLHLVRRIRSSTEVYGARLPSRRAPAPIRAR